MLFEFIQIWYRHEAVTLLLEELAGSVIVGIKYFDCSLDKQLLTEEFELSIMLTLNS